MANDKDSIIIAKQGDANNALNSIVSLSFQLPLGPFI